MFLLAPGNPKQLNERAQWFKTEAARKLAADFDVQFGFELKGAPENITEAPPLFWGYHLSDYFATEWYYHPNERQELFKRIVHLSKLKPNYLNFHGIHLWYKPDEMGKMERYINHSDSEEYLKVLDSNIEFVKELKKILPETRITMECYPLHAYYTKNGEFLLETYLYTGSGRLNDLLYLKEKAGIEILLDIEHLILTLNFLNRERNYKDVPVIKIENPSEITKKLYEIFGFYIKEGYYPYVDQKVDLAQTIKNFDAKIYHLTGSVQEIIPGVRNNAHAPIEINDPVFRTNLRMILVQKPEAMLVETADSTVNPCFSHLRSNETEISFDNLCRILLEELKR